MDLACIQRTWLLTYGPGYHRAATKQTDYDPPASAPSAAYPAKCRCGNEALTQKQKRKAGESRAGQKKALRPRAAPRGGHFVRRRRAHQRRGAHQPQVRNNHEDRALDVDAASAPLARGRVPCRGPSTSSSSPPRARRLPDT
jgi:hypothetical protein